jgi:CRP/FNR family transcriptional regulator
VLDLLPPDSCRPLSLPPRAIVAPAELAGALLAVEEGFVLVTARSGIEGRRSVVALAGAGSVLPCPGEGELLESLSAARVTVLSEDGLRELLADPAAAEALADALLAAVRDRQESLRWFGHVRHAERVRGKLLQLARDHGRVAARGIRLDLPLTHELLADMIGSSRETVTMALAELQREGFVSRSGRWYRLDVAPDAL